MSAQPNHDEILTALRKSGYLMEQEVATQLETLGFHVNTNWAFEDSDEKKSREIDVRAIRRVAHNEEKYLSAFVEILVECKNNATPFVFIGRKKNQIDNQYAPLELVFPICTYEMRRKLDSSRSRIREKDAFFHLGFDEIHYDFARSLKTVQFCRLDRKGKDWTANHGNMYNAIFFPLAKAVTIRKKEVIPKRNDRWRYFWFFIPVVVLSGDIYYVDSSGAYFTEVCHPFHVKVATHYTAKLPPPGA